MLKCGSCGGAIALVSGKTGGYYGCLNGSRRSCDNRKLIARKRLETKFVDARHEAVLNPDVVDLVCERTLFGVRCRAPETTANDQ